MIFGHEGQVRSGKSYEAVQYHILPAIKAGRHVFFRLNGVDECAAKIAERLEMSEADVRALLHPMGNDEVHGWLVCDSANDGTLTFPHVPMHSLVVVDEVHEYFPVGRAALPERNGNFFAKHGHISLDVVLITQDFKEVHRSIVRRIGKKNFYTKLDALGKDNWYSVRFYSSPAAGKFELIGSEKREYDSAVFETYHGVQPGVEGNAVYKANSRTLWQTVKKPAIAMALVVLLGIFFIARFFTSGASVTPEQKRVAKAAPVARAVQDVAPAAIPGAVARAIPTKAEPIYPPGIAYVLDIAKDSRPRYAAMLDTLLVLEFRTAGGQVVERLTSRQLIALGWTVESTEFGAVIRYEDQSMIFTAWPIDLPGQQSEQTARRIASAGPPVVSASEQQPAPAAMVQESSGSSMSARYGGFRP